MPTTIDPDLAAALGRVRAAFAAGEPDGIRELLAADSFAIDGDGSIVAGDDLVPWYARFVTAPTALTLRPRWVRQVGDYAVLSSDWSTAGTSPAGDPVAGAGRSADLLRREPDGSWRILADNPFNAAVGGGATPLVDVPGDPELDRQLGAGGALLAAGRLEDFRATWHEGAFGIDRDGAVLRGDALLDWYGWFVQPQRGLAMTPRWVRRHGDVAIVAMDWSIDGTDDDGAPVAATGTSADVHVRDASGTWRLLVDNPYNAAVPAD